MGVFSFYEGGPGGGGAGALPGSGGFDFWSGTYLPSQSGTLLTGGDNGLINATLLDANGAPLVPPQYFSWYANMGGYGGNLGMPGGPQSTTPGMTSNPYAGAAPGAGGAAIIGSSFIIYEVVGNIYGGIS